MSKQNKYFMEIIRTRGPWLWLFGYAVGAVVCQKYGAPVYAVLCLSPVLLGLLVFFYMKGKIKSFVVIVLLCSVFAGGLRSTASILDLEKAKTLTDFVNGSDSRVLLRVDRIPERNPGYTVFRGVIEKIFVDGGWSVVGARTRIAVGSDIDGIYRGDRLLMMASLKTPRSFKNPGGFDYEAFLKRRGIIVTGWTKTSDQVIKINGPGKISIYGMIDRAREGLINKFRSVNSPGAELLAALALGDREGLSPSLETAFEKTGLSHILAISGLHLGLIAAFFYYFLLIVLKKWSWLSTRVAAHKSAAFGTVPIVIFYAMMTGMRVPTQRASVLVLTYLIAVLLDKRRDFWNTLALAGSIILFIWPQALWETSFQLSFICVSGIVYSLPRAAIIFYGRKTKAEIELDRLEKIFLGENSGRMKRALNYMAGIFLTSLMAQLFVFPLLAGYFHSFNFITPLYNLIAVPVTGFFLVPAGTASALLAAVFPGAGQYLIHCVSIPADWFAGLIVWSSKTIDAQLLVPSMSFVGILSWYCFLFFLLESLFLMRAGSWSWIFFSPGQYRQNIYYDGGKSPGGVRRTGKYVLLFVAAVFFTVSICDMYRDKGLLPEDGALLAVLDVGQGQALLYRSSCGKHLLVDGGGFFVSSWDVGKGIVAPCLLALGVTRLDAVALSHPHPDHARGLEYILENFRARELWMINESNSLSKALLEKAKAKGTRVRCLSGSSSSFAFGSSQIHVLGPPPDADIFGDNLNDKSMVLKIVDGGHSFLLTGDIEEDAERMLVKKYGDEGTTGPSMLRSHVLSVPHHASKTSSTERFIYAVKPLAALASGAGPDKSGLPSVEVLKRYEDREVEILRTDLHGFSFVYFENGGLKTVRYAWEKAPDNGPL